MPVALITGVTGQTGSYLAELLQSREWEIHGLVRSDDPARGSTLPGGAIAHVGDLADPQSLRDVIRASNPDLTFNLAALSSVAQSWKEPVATAELDAVAVAVILDEMLALQRETGVDRAVVQASSAEIFGAASSAPQSETTPIRPSNPYGAAKAYAHHLVGVYRAVGLRASSAILYNHESPRRPTAFVTRKITSTVARISAGLETGLVLGDLTVRRDWGWAPDYADALWRIGTAPAGGDYVVATGEDHSIADFVAAAFAAVGIDDWESLVTTDPTFVRPTDAPELRGDASKIARELGWRPTVGFAEIVSAMMEHDRSAAEQGA